MPRPWGFGALIALFGLGVGGFTACVGADVSVSPAPAADADAGPSPAPTTTVTAPPDGGDAKSVDAGPICTVGETRPCPDYPFPNAHVGGSSPCSVGIETCESLASGPAWGSCTGVVTPAPADSCDPGNDANCDGVPNQGCGCVAGDTGTCASKLASKGACASGTATCLSGKFQCSVIPQAHDSCDKTADDSTCNGLANEGCTCVKGGAGSTASCGLCGLGTKTCLGGASPSGYGACVEAAGACSPSATRACTPCSALFPGSQTCSGSCAYGTCNVANNASFTGHATDFDHACGVLEGDQTTWYASESAGAKCLMQHGHGTQLMPGSYSANLTWQTSCLTGNGFAATAALQIWRNGALVVQSRIPSPTTIGNKTGSNVLPFTVPPAFGCSASSTYELVIVFDPDSENSTFGCDFYARSTSLTYVSP